ncbi:MAG: Holliday junction branch migration protein RuvA [Paracoccaceae bacterium]|jgi:Holliday junction DNA helicase RuvA
MIGKLSGRIDFRASDYILLDVRGVGYIVHVSERTLAGLPPVGQAVALYTELLVREDLLQLFGFPTMIEKEWHRILMTVQGVGAKAAMAILSALGTEGAARAITLGDVRAVQAAQGIGPKIAQRVVLELKSKAPTLMAAGAALGVEAQGQEGDDVIEPIMPSRAAAKDTGPSAGQIRAATAADALSALLNLGYDQSDAASAVAQAAGLAPEADSAMLILASLKLLAPKA